MQSFFLRIQMMCGSSGGGLMRLASHRRGMTPFVITPLHQGRGGPSPGALTEAAEPKPGHGKAAAQEDGRKAEQQIQGDEVSSL